jgi:aminopeptidase
VAKPLVLEVIKAVQEVGAYPYYELLDDEIIKATRMVVDEKYFENLAKWRKVQNQDVDAYIAIRAVENDSELSDVPLENMKMASQIMQPVSRILIDEKKWVLLNYPTYGLAQKAKMSYEKFYDYLVEVCTVDYARMNDSFKPLKALMERTDKVHIVGPGTDLRFSIKGIPAVPCAGECNIPDGEIFTAPVKDSVNGTITYNTPSPYQGIVYQHVSLTFKDGKIVKCTADSDNDKLEEIFNTDDGARYVGEFAIGVNPAISKPMGDILFDEKIGGSLHFTPGACYKGEADNGNSSAIHWDLVLIQTKAYGGGEIYFDDVLIRKDGVFVLDELKGLNIENLK